MGRVDFDRIRAQLGIDYPPGRWFILPAALLRWGTANYPHPAITGTSTVDPVVRVVPRSTKNRINHPAHDHGRCAINKPGHIFYDFYDDVRVIPRREFVDTRFSCEEPDPDVIKRVIRIVTRH